MSERASEWTNEQDSERMCDAAEMCACVCTAMQAHIVAYWKCWECIIIDIKWCHEFAFVAALKEDKWSPYYAWDQQ